MNGALWPYPRRDLVPEIGGRRSSGHRPFGERCPRTAEARAVADGKDGADARPAVLVTLRHEMTAGRIELVPRVERSEKLVRRLEAVTEADRVHLVELLLTSARRSGDVHAQPVPLHVDPADHASHGSAVRRPTSSRAR